MSKNCFGLGVSTDRLQEITADNAKGTVPVVMPNFDEIRRTIVEINNHRFSIFNTAVSAMGAI